MKNTLIPLIIFLTGLIYSCDNFTATDKVIFYQIDTVFYKNHPNLFPQVSIKNVDSLFNDLDKKGKELTTKQFDDLNKIINHPFYHGDKDCGTIRKDGILVFYNNKNQIDKFAVVSMDCYDLILYKGSIRLGKINLNEEGQKFLFTLFK